ncbi:MAG TPA: SDR family oxidoreductase [Terriglobales bacterium]|jgi:enoyl-[acyl-carrier-protein] reductase (NADH)|nr:SDR family oxidoreductase [Terriglobales bacterium]
MPDCDANLWWCSTYPPAQGKEAARTQAKCSKGDARVGCGTVREFARHGAHIGLLAWNMKRLRGAQKEVEAEGGKAIVLTDVADPDQVERAAAAVEKKLGQSLLTHSTG